MKGILIEKYSIGYKDIPKVACTSIKKALFELDTGEKFKIDKMSKHVHQYYGERVKNISSADFKFIVIRDPIKRFLSGYSNRVTFHKELSLDYLKPFNNSGCQALLYKNVPLDPNLGQFIDFFYDYYSTPSIYHHLRPISTFIDDLDFFDKIYTLENISSVEEDIKKITGKDFILPREQTGGVKFSIKDINSKQLDFLFDFYRKDYELMNEFYTIDDIWNSWRK